jgi:preprotein translocase subunit SecE
MNPKSKGFNPIEFLQEVKVELGLVSWPSRQETLKLTGMVIAISLIIAFYLGVLDASFLKIFSNLINSK